MIFMHTEIIKLTCYYKYATKSQSNTNRRWLNVNFYQNKKTVITHSDQNSLNLHQHTSAVLTIMAEI